MSGSIIKAGGFILIIGLILAVAVKIGFLGMHAFNISSSSINLQFKFLPLISLLLFIMGGTMITVGAAPLGPVGLIGLILFTIIGLYIWTIMFGFSTLIGIQLPSLPAPNLFIKGWYILV